MEGAFSDKDKIIKDNLQIIKGLVKKYGPHFTLIFKYKTNVGKIRKRQGKFLDIVEGSKIKVYNEGKGQDAIYELSRILGLHKKG